MTTEQIVGLVVGSGLVGAVVPEVVRWLMGRGERRQARLDHLRETILTETRADSKELRAQIAVLQGQLQQVNQQNLELRGENMKLQQANGMAEARINGQSEIIANQALQISTLQNDLAGAKDRIGSLESAMRQANVPLPEVSRRRGDTGPLSAEGLRP